MSVVKARPTCAGFYCYVTECTPFHNSRSDLHASERVDAHSDVMGLDPSVYLRPLLAADNTLKLETMALASQELDVEAVLKGIEVSLPVLHKFYDKDGYERDRVRVRWWESAGPEKRQKIIDQANRIAAKPK